MSQSSKPGTEDSNAPLLRDSVEAAIAQFLRELEGESCVDLYDMVLAQMEEPLLRVVLEHTDGNQSRAAALLGLNRGTLRTKLRRYGLLASSD